MVDQSKNSWIGWSATSNAGLLKNETTFCPPPTPPPQIYFWEFQLQNETERLRTLFLPELGVKLKNLTGYTTYMISVAAFNAAGDGPRSLPTRGRTQQAGMPTGQILI